MAQCRWYKRAKTAGGAAAAGGATLVRALLAVQCSCPLAQPGVPGLRERERARERARERERAVQTGTRASNLTTRALDAPAGCAAAVLRGRRPHPQAGGAVRLSRGQLRRAAPHVDKWYCDRPYVPGLGRVWLVLSVCFCQFVFWSARTRPVWVGHHTGTPTAPETPLPRAHTRTYGCTASATATSCATPAPLADSPRVPRRGVAPGGRD